MQTLVLMGVYNGERYISRQIDSIRAQTDSDWQLLVRDDGSSDATRTLVGREARRDPRIELARAEGYHLGVVGNFSELMQRATAGDQPYIAFCDQDDVWSAQKLARQTAAMAELERVHGRHCPLLVHSDLSLVGQDLEPLQPSLMRCHLIRRPEAPAALTLLMQNHVVGCTMLMNRALLTLATPLPEGVYMHDWWVALCARFTGVTQYLPEPLVAYRQHHGNQVGAHGLGERLARPARWLSWVRKMNGIYYAAFAQARQLELRLQSIDRSGCASTGVDVDTDTNGDDSLQPLRAFIELGRKPRLLRPWSLLRIGGHSQNALMTGLFYVQSSTLAGTMRQ